MKTGNNVLPLTNMRDELLSIVLEIEKFVTVFVDRGRELVLDSLPSGEIRGVLVPVLPHGAPRLEDGARRGGAYLTRRREAVLENAADHERVRLGIEGVELRRYVRLGRDVEGRFVEILGSGCRVRGELTQTSGVSRGIVGGGVARGRRRRRPEEHNFRQRERRLAVVRIGNGRLRFNDLGGKWVQIIVKTMVVEEILFNFARIHLPIEQEQE